VGNERKKNAASLNNNERIGKQFVHGKNRPIRGRAGPKQRKPADGVNERGKGGVLRKNK